MSTTTPTERAHDCFTMPNQNPMTTDAAARIQSSEAKAGGGGVSSDSFAARAQVIIFIFYAYRMCSPSQGSRILALGDLLEINNVLGKR